MTRKSPTRPDDINDEVTALLRAQSDDPPHEPTPLPTAQISDLVLPWIAETIVSRSTSIRFVGGLVAYNFSGLIRI